MWSFACLWWCGLAFLLTTEAFRLRIDKQIEKSCVKCHPIDDKKINVHLIPHSHDDVGWLKTLDQYYWGLNKTIVDVGVQYIITSVVKALLENPERRYIQVETAFFWKWWQNADEDMRTKFKSLVDNGQLEIINGGWSMNDEACVTYQSTIDQFTWGFRVLDETVGDCGKPTIGWQIDPFGHSREHASLLSKIGFDGLFFARLDQEDRKKRELDGDFDFLWKASANNDDSNIFGSMFAPTNLYFPPTGFCFDEMCGDDPIVDNPDEDTYNLDAKVELFVDYIYNYTAYFKTKNIVILMGGDFQYQAADINFANSDKLVKAFENHADINLIYSTPSCYLKAVYDAQPNLTVKTDDFFPYGSADHTYWTGYFTTRQNFKRFERVSRNILQVAKQLNFAALAKGYKDVNVASLRKLTEGIGVAQHHDSITGTAKQHVAHDYNKILAKGIAEAESNFTTLLGQLLDIDLVRYTNLTSCLLANISICPTTQHSDKFLVTLYNPLAWPVNYPVRLPVDGQSYEVVGPEGKVSSDLLKPISSFDYVEYDEFKPAKAELVFVASDIPPLGVKSYVVSKTEAGHKAGRMQQSKTLTFGNENIAIEIDNGTHLLKSVTVNGKTFQVTQKFMHYTSHNGTKDSDPSGAYIFRPTEQAKPFGNPKLVSTTLGETVDEIHQQINSWITQIIRVYKTGPSLVEFDWLVGPLDVSNDHGIEIVSRFTIEDFDNEQIFYTDSNGREMIQRKLNYRPTFSYNSSIEPIASNYYPVTTKISIKDDKKKIQMTVLNDRSQGGASLDNGQIELMVHRRTLRDDSKGVDEPMNDTEFRQGIVARGQHYLILGPIPDLLDDGKSLTAQERIVAQQKLLQPWVGVGDVSKVPTDVIDKILSQNYSTVRKALPENINILTLEPWVNSTYLLRLEHVLEKEEDPNLSETVTVDLTDLFSDLSISEITETTLGANRKLESGLTKYDWSYKSPSSVYKSALEGTKVTLSPMDIKTFIIKLSV